MSFSEHMLRGRSEDGLRLDGVGIMPDGEFLPTGVVWVHDHFASFYNPPYIEVSRALAERGFLSVVGNTRGHDFGAVLSDRSGRPIVGGSGWERFHEGPYDITTWISAAIRLGADDVILVGHGFGGRKVVYYQVERNDPRVKGVAVASAGLDYPPVDPDLLARAEDMVAHGQGRDILPWPPIGAGMSAQTFVDAGMTYQNILYEHNGRPGVVSRLHSPLLVFCGETEDAPARIETNLKTVARNAHASARVSTAIIPGIGRLYTDGEEGVADLLDQWIETL